MNRNNRFWRIWDRHHVKAGWITVGLIAGGVAGMTTGSYAACAGEPLGCNVSWDAVEAIGTWFGAVGGLLAVGAAIATFRSSEEARQAELRGKQQAQVEKEAAEEARASRVLVSSSSQSYSGDALTGIDFKIHNSNTDIAIYNVALSIDLDYLVPGEKPRKVFTARNLPPNGDGHGQLSMTPPRRRFPARCRAH